MCPSKPRIFDDFHSLAPWLEVLKETVAIVAFRHSTWGSSKSRHHGIDKSRASPIFITHRIHGAGIYANIGGISMVNVTIYTIQGSYIMGYWTSLSWFHFQRWTPRNERGVGKASSETQRRVQKASLSWTMKTTDRFLALLLDRNLSEKTMISYAGWWFQPLRKNMSQLGWLFPKQYI